MSSVATESDSHASDTLANIALQEAIKTNRKEPIPLYKHQ